MRALGIILIVLGVLMLPVGSGMNWGILTYIVSPLICIGAGFALIYLSRKPKKIE